MAKFISLSLFSAHFNTPADLMEPEGLARFTARLTPEVKAELCEKHGFNPAELQDFIDSLRQSENVLFQSWITQNSTLENLLVEGKLESFEDRGKHLDHVLSERFRRFVSPSLATRLLSFSDVPLERRKKAFTFIPLLDVDHSSAVEGQLFASLRDDMKAAKLRAQSMTSEQELLEMAAELCSDEVLFCVNGLSRSMYATRLQYVDDALSFIRSRACSARLANWILKQMERIRLNSEHRYKLEDLRGELARGELKVKNNLEKGRAPIRWRRVGLFFLVLITFFSLVYIAMYERISAVDPVEIADDTSFEQFSVDERKRIDSMLQQMNGEREEEEYIDAGGNPIMPGGTAISLRKAYNNKSLERLCDDFDRDAVLQGAGHSDSCTRALPFTPLAGTGDLDKHKGSLAAMFRNESDYDVIVVLGNNTTGGSVYSTLLKGGEQKVVNMSQGDIVLVIAGNTFHAYTAPQGVPQSELPSTFFKHHFCKTDFNYAETINSPYEVVRTLKGKTKFLITGTRGDYLDVVDIYDVLEPW